MKLSDRMPKRLLDGLYGVTPLPDGGFLLDRGKGIVRYSADLNAAPTMIAPHCLSHCDNIVLSRDGTMYAFEDTTSIVVRRLDATASDPDVARFQGQGVYYFHPSWLSDGRIAFYSRGIGLFVATIGGAPTRLDPNLNDPQDPAVSPDGTQIPFIMNGGNKELYVMTIDGMDLRQLTNGGGTFSAGKWSPDGRYLVVQSGVLKEYVDFIRVSDGKVFGHLKSSDSKYVSFLHDFVWELYP
ncbi:MAG TPA: hypothetical protein VNH83_20855 [Bryobacteraceae bacterium]|nr:hypothetical protein [Bryobacteraceae bacterium]